MKIVLGIVVVAFAILYFAGMAVIDKMGKYKRDDDKTF